MAYSVDHTIDASLNDARSRAARSHAQPLVGEHGEHGARSRRTLDGAATIQAPRTGSGDNGPAPLPCGEQERAWEGNPSHLSLDLGELQRQLELDPARGRIDRLSFQTAIGTDEGEDFNASPSLGLLGLFSSNGDIERNDRRVVHLTVASPPNMENPMLGEGFSVNSPGDHRIGCCPNVSLFRRELATRVNDLGKGVLDEIFEADHSRTLSQRVENEPDHNLASLDNHASNVSDLGWRQLRYELRRTAGAIIGGRQARCGAAPLLNTVDLMRGREGRHTFTGLETCGSVWTCPVCAMKVSAVRCEELRAAIAAHLMTGGTVWMLTLTIPHHRFQTAKELLNAVRASWRSVKQGRGWKVAREAHGWVGDVRALETTHGGNGWHPHIHVLVFLDAGVSEEDARGFGEWIFARWATKVEKQGYGICSRSAFTMEPVEDGDGAGGYLALWGAAQELTLSPEKRGKGGRSPWEILDDARQFGRAADQALFHDYADAFKGARQLTWSRGLRKRLLGTAEQSDQDLAAESYDAEARRTAILTKPLWAVIHGRALQNAILEAADAGGTLAVLGALDRARIRYTVIGTVGQTPILALITDGTSRPFAIRCTAVKVADAPPPAVASGQP